MKTNVIPSEVRAVAVHSAVASLRTDEGTTIGKDGAKRNKTQRKIPRTSLGMTFIMAVALPLLLSGCMNDDTDINCPAGNGRSIVFSPAVNSAAASRSASGETGAPASRATSDANGSLVESGANIPVGGMFGVVAFHIPNGGSAQLYDGMTPNTAVKNTGTAAAPVFTYTPPANWPTATGDKLSFLAYYPWQDQSNEAIQQEISSGSTIIGFTSFTATGFEAGVFISSDPSKHKDLMYAYGKPTIGYDPVPLTFGHALTRLKFTAKKEDYTAAVSITGIKIKNASRTGKWEVDATDPDDVKSSWEFFNGEFDRGDFTYTTSNGLTGAALTDEYVSQLTDGGKDMLLFPQEVDDIVVEVTATVGDETKTFEYPLDGSPEWEMNRIVTYQITLSGDGSMTIDAKVTGWNEGNDVTTLFDGQYYMELSHSRLDFAKEGGEVTVTVKTDHPDGITPGEEPPSGGAWWTGNSQFAESGGVHTLTLTLNAPVNTGAAKEPGKLIFTAGNMNYEFHMTQSGDSWLTADPTFYILDGDMYGFDVTATGDWTVEISTHIIGNNPSYGGKPLITNLLTKSGKAGAGTVSFVTQDDLSRATPEVTGPQKVWLTFHDPARVNADVDVEVTLVSQFTNEPITASTGFTYVGAFWKAGETAERVVRVPVAAAATGKWAARLLDPGNNFAKADVLFAKSEYDYATYPLPATAPAVSDGKGYAQGDAAAMGDEIKFRMGLRAQLGGATAAPRYAVAVIGYNNYTKFQKVYLRQGEADDYVMTPGQAGMTTASARPAAQRFSPYNLTTPNRGAGSTFVTAGYDATLATRGGEPTDFPTKAGAMWQFASGANPRYAYSPVLTAANFDITQYPTWSDDQETCPPGYRRPAGNTAADSEFFQSLCSNEGSFDGNSVWGCYADGYFDRLATGNPPMGYANSAVDATGIGVGYAGAVFYNPATTGSHRNASLFFPAAGEREGSDFIDVTGAVGNYWSSSYATPPFANAGAMLSFKYNMPYLTSGYYGNGVSSQGHSIRCVVDPDYKPAPSDPNAYIEWEVDFSTGTFMVPLTGAGAATGAPYNLNFYLNGVLYGTENGTVDIISSGKNYTITGTSGATARVRITSADNEANPAIGWGRVIGFFSSGGASVQTNKDKLVRVLNDPDYAYCQSATSTGNYFRSYQYFGCGKLTSVPAESLPSTITTIGNDFRSSQYYGCSLLAAAATESLPSGVTAIGNNFRRSQYTTCGTLTTASPESMPSGINTASIGNYFRCGQYQACNALLIGGYVHSFQFPDLLNAASSNYQSMFLGSVTATDTVPLYYTNAGSTATLPVTYLTPTTDKDYIYGRSGIADWSNINDNWK